jgi:hypothetical protein
LGGPQSPTDVGKSSTVQPRRSKSQTFRERSRLLRQKRKLPTWSLPDFGPSSDGRGSSLNKSNQPRPANLGSSSGNSGGGLTTRSGRRVRPPDRIDL